MLRFLKALALGLNCLTLLVIFFLIASHGMPRRGPELLLASLVLVTPALTAYVIWQLGYSKVVCLRKKLEIAKLEQQLEDLSKE